MAQSFSINEIIEMGINIEINGRDYYNTLSNTLKIKDLKELFQYLAKEEEKHINSFQKLLNSISQDKSNDEFNEEYFAYLYALAGDYVFTKKNRGIESANKINNYVEAITMAIGFEKDSIIFYEGMKRTMSKDNAKIVDILIKQEQNHLIKLIKYKI